MVGDAETEGVGLPPPVFRTERPDGGAGLPHLRLVHRLQLGVEFLPVVGGVIHRKDDPRLLAGTDAFVELVEDRGDRVAEGVISRAIRRAIRTITT